MSGKLTCDRISIALLQLNNRIGPALECANEPAANSLAERERQGFLRPSLLTDAFGLSGMLLDVVLDHLRLLVRALVDPPAEFSTWSCVRAMLEPAALATWIVDPEIDAAERVRRVLAYRVSCLDEQVRFCVDHGRPQSEMAKLCVRTSHLKSLGKQLGYNVKNLKKGRIEIGEKLPGPTALIWKIFADPLRYSLASGVAHAQHWAIRQLFFDLPENSSGLLADEVALVRKAGIARFRLAALWALDSVARPVLARVAYFGHERDLFEEIIDDAADSLRIAANKKARFWRNQ